MRPNRPTNPRNDSRRSLVRISIFVGKEINGPRREIYANLERIFSAGMERDYMKIRLNKLLTVKSIVTLFLTIAFCCLALRGVVTGHEFLTIFTTVIAFYFGTQTNKIEERSHESS